MIQGSFQPSNIRIIEKYALEYYFKLRRCCLVETISREQHLNNKNNNVP